MPLWGRLVSHHAAQGPLLVDAVGGPPKKCPAPPYGENRHAEGEDPARDQAAYEHPSTPPPTRLREQQMRVGSQRLRPRIGREG